MSLTDSTKRALIQLPMKLPSLANTRMHWRALSSVKKKQKEVVALALYGVEVPALPVVVTLTRIGKRKLDDDNLASAFKYCRDEVARHIGEDDGSSKFTWRYEQKIGKKYGIEIAIESRTA